MKKITEIQGLLAKTGADLKLVEPKNPEQLSEALRFYLENPETAKKTGEQNRKYVTENFSWTKTASETELLYKALITKPQGVLHENN